jgi:uncharacterized protein YcfJ
MSGKTNSFKMTAVKRGKRWAGMLTLALLVGLGGCANMARTGAVVGGLTGALIGGHFGPDAGIRGTNALIGAGIGAGFGYMVGNEMDKTRYRPYYYDDRPAAHHTFYHEGTRYVYDAQNGYYVAVP